jgi:hypothetical protein
MKVLLGCGSVGLVTCARSFKRAPLDHRQFLLAEFDGTAENARGALVWR